MFKIRISSPVMHEAEFVGSGLGIIAFCRAAYNPSRICPARWILTTATFRSPFHVSYQCERLGPVRNRSQNRKMANGPCQVLGKDAFTVGWICALPIELTTSEAMLDDVYPALEQVQGDENIYTLGRIGQHNIVIAWLSAGSTGIAPAAKVAKDMLRSFPQIRFGLMIGIGGGAPSVTADIRLGDVVVGVPDGELGEKLRDIAARQLTHTMRRWRGEIRSREDCAKWDFRAYGGAQYASFAGQEWREQITCKA
jgi:hypothetical protein